MGESFSKMEEEKGVTSSGRPDREGRDGVGEVILCPFPSLPTYPPGGRALFLLFLVPHPG